MTTNRVKWTSTAHWSDGTTSQCIPMSRRDAERWARKMRDVALVRSVDEPVTYLMTNPAHEGTDEDYIRQTTPVLSEDAYVSDPEGDRADARRTYGKEF